MPHYSPALKELMGMSPETQLLNARHSYLSAMEGLDMAEKLVLETAKEFISHPDERVRGLAGELMSMIGRNPGAYESDRFPA